MIKACLFDMDGLLLDTERQMYLQGGLKISAELGRPVSERSLRAMMGLNWTDYYARIKEEYGEDYPIDAYRKKFLEHVDRMIGEFAFDLRPGVKEVLDFCADNHIRMGVATSTPQERTLKCLKNAGILDCFDVVMSGDMVQNGKPDPEIYLTAAGKLGVSKEDAIVFEDGHNGALAALNGGFRLILVEDLARITDEDRERALMVLNRIDQALPYMEKEL